jgi:hypothetical protein
MNDLIILLFLLFWFFIVFPIWYYIDKKLFGNKVD